MKYLLSLPPNLVEHFHELTGHSADSWFCTADPVDSRLGSGGGTVWLLSRCKEAEGNEVTFSQWLKTDKRVLIHAGGCGRRIPAYASCGKVLTPIPLISDNEKPCEARTLLDLQTPFYSRVIEHAPTSLNTMIVSGDVMITASEIGDIPDADVVCFGMKEPTSLASNHGVFVVSREEPDVLDYMLQKPSTEVLNELSTTHSFLMDIGLWLLSDRAVERLISLASDKNGNISYYDLYGDYGLGLGRKPSKPCNQLADLNVKIVNLDGRFLHYGTSRELLSSTASLRPGLDKAQFVFNADSKASINDVATNVWVENSYLPASWTLCGRNIVTGVPANDWQITLSEGRCVDIVPVDEEDFVLRPYGFNDKFSGAVTDKSTMFMEQSLEQWMEKRGVTSADFSNTADIQDAELFPVSRDIELLGSMLRWFVDEKPDRDVSELWRRCRRVSANTILIKAALLRVQIQRTKLSHLPAMKIPIVDYNQAFAELRDGLVDNMLSNKSVPRMTVLPDQVVCGRCPVRADIAGGWTDTPPYSVYEGGKVVNFAFDINGQPPLHVYIKPIKDFVMVCRSIDLGMSETIATYEELDSFGKVGSPFSIPKAALALAGFLPRFCGEEYDSLHNQLEAMGCGLEIVMLAAVPAGSGLGTSSILAATVLATLSDFCGLGWSQQEVCRRTLVLEQLLTTGGGWQDQYGGVLPGVKLLQSRPGLNQKVDATYLPTHIFGGEAANCHLMFYTGITRIAKHILVDIVKGMFVKEAERLVILREMKQHALNMQRALEQNSMNDYGRLVRRSWEFNCRLDSGTNPAKVQELCRRIDDLCLGYKLLGAGGGGYMYMVAKDPDAACRLRRMLTEEPLCATSRVVMMSLSANGLQISRS